MFAWQNVALRTKAEVLSWETAGVGLGSPKIDCEESALSCPAVTHSHLKSIAVFTTKMLGQDIFQFITQS